MTRRQDVERRSAVLLTWLSARPRWVLPLVTAALLGGLLFAPTVPALVCGLAVLAVVGWLSYLSWPAVDGRGRAVRVATVVLLGVLVVQSIS